MNDAENLVHPAALAGILEETGRLGFAMASEPLTGSLLRTLVQSKVGGAVLELGTGTGVGTAWLLDGLDPSARLVTVESDAALTDVARRHLGSDARVTFVVDDAADFVRRAGDRRFDFIFADTWVGKFTHVDDVLVLLASGGLYVVDDMLPQPNWPNQHGDKVDAVIAGLEARPALRVSKLSWGSGLVIAAKRG